MQRNGVKKVCSAPNLGIFVKEVFEVVGEVNDALLHLGDAAPPIELNFTEELWVVCHLQMFQSCVCHLKHFSIQLVLLSCNWCHLNISRLTLSAMWGRYLKKANSQLTISVAGQENICEISNVAGFRKREQVYVFCFAVRHDENPISTFVQERDFLSFNQLKLLYFPILGPFPVQGEFFFLLMALALACL